MKLCKCGCGLEVSKGCNFKKGHYARYDNPMNYEKYRKKVSEGQLGKKRPPLSEEHKRILSELLTGKPKSEEHKRKISESKKGELNPAYKGGISCEPYCPDFSDQGWRQIFYERDNNTCQNCGITKMLSYKVYERDLSIHHIDYNKKNCGRNNCLLLCCRCNTKANLHRWMWELIFKDKLGLFD